MELIYVLFCFVAAQKYVAFYWSSLVSVGMDGNLWIADPVEQTVKMIDNSTFSATNSVVYLVVGTVGVSGYRMGDYITSQFNGPTSAVLFSNETDDYLFIADTGNHCIKLFRKSTLQVELFAGVCLTPGFLDGPFGINLFNNPEQIGFANNTLFIVDRGNRAFRMVDMKTRYVLTLSLTSCQEQSGTQQFAAPLYNFSSNILNTAFNLPIHTMYCDTTQVLTTGPQVYSTATDPTLSYCLEQIIMCGNRDSPFIRN